MVLGSNREGRIEGGLVSWLIETLFARVDRTGHNQSPSMCQGINQSSIKQYLIKTRFLFWHFLSRTKPEQGALMRLDQGPLKQNSKYLEHLILQRRLDLLAWHDLGKHLAWSAFEL